MASKDDKVVPMPTRAGPPAMAGVPFNPSASDMDEADATLGRPFGGKPAASQGVVEGVDLSDRPKIILLVGRGKTGKTTAVRWMAERALAAGRPVLMADLDPTNASFSQYFEGVHRPDDAGNQAATLRWTEGFVGHGLRSRVNTVIDMGGGDTILNRMATELGDLPGMVDEAGAALVVLFHLGPQVDDLTPIATMQDVGLTAHAIAVVMNEASVDPGRTREDHFARVMRHAVFRQALSDGATPVWMPRLHGAEVIEARRLLFMAARDGAVGDSGRASLGPFDRARVRSWLAAMDRQYAGVETWLP